MDIEIRWNSTFKMLNAAAKMKNSIDSFISVDQRPASSQLKSLTSNVDDTICDLEELTLKSWRGAKQLAKPDWGLVSEIIKILEPFHSGNT
jgi:hypothetical protein